MNYLQNDFHASIIRSKGLFWLASRPVQAITWSQAGGSVQADSAGVWWSSMPLQERVNFVSYFENQKFIESTWDTTFGDRKNELVFIGQDLDQEIIIKELNYCLCTDDEIDEIDWENGEHDSWSIPRATPPHKENYT